MGGADRHYTGVETMLGSLQTKFISYYGISISQGTLYSNVSEQHILYGHSVTIENQAENTLSALFKRYLNVYKNGAYPLLDRL